MQRRTLIDALRAIVRKVEELRLKDGIHELLRARPEAGVSIQVRPQLDQVKDFSFWLRSSSPETQEVAARLHLDMFDSTAAWIAILAAERETVWEMDRVLTFVTKYIPPVIHLLSNEADHISKNPRAVEGHDLLHVIAIEEPGQSSSPQRLIKILESVNELYQVCVAITKSSSSTLSVVGCDSGSDKSFDFLGVAKAIQCLKDVLLSLWDKVVFYREKKMAVRIELVAKSLPVLDEIARMEQDKALSAEQAEILRRKIVSGASSFLETGVVIPEMIQSSTFVPRQLMAPEPKLLTEGSPIDTSKERARTIHDESESDDLTDEERVVLKRISQRRSPKNDPGNDR